jgi:hypothetical protein
MSTGTFIVIFVPKGMFIMIRPNRKVPLELLLWGTNKRLQPKGLSTIAEDKIQTREAQKQTQQQPTDITQKITNAHEQHELPMNLKWTRVFRKSKQFLPIAIHLCVSIIKSGRTLIRWRAKDLKQLILLRVLGSPMGYHDNHWKKPK